jgi:hypothetical protein
MITYRPTGKLENFAGRASSVATARTLQRIANQPGFHGVHAMALFAFATNSGYEGPLPQLFFVQKLPHGKPATYREVAHASARLGVDGWLG